MFKTIRSKLSLGLACSFFALLGCIGCAYASVLGGVSSDASYGGINAPASGAFTITATDGKTELTDDDYAYANGVLTIKSTTPMTIKNTDATASTTDRILIGQGSLQAGNTVNLTLAGVNIAATVGSAMEIADNAAFNVTLTLADNSENVLETQASFFAGIQKCSSGGSVGTLTFQGNTGELLATGGNQGAGIGSHDSHLAENIVFDGGKITANGGGLAAGIGGGNLGSGNKITIKSGTVIANGGWHGAGIGGGVRRGGSDITISGGTVISTGGEYGAGIGTGGVNGGDPQEVATNIVISGGNVTATGGKYASGIGGGFKSSEKGVIVSGGTIEATGGQGGSGIGCGVYGSAAENQLNGNAVLIAKGVEREGIVGFDGNLTKGIVFSAKDSSPYVGVMYGNVTVSNDVTFPGDLTVGATTTSNDLQTLTVDYKTTINLVSSTLTNDKNGAIIINKDTTDPSRGGHISGGTIKTVVAYSVPTGITPPSDGNFVYIDDGQSTYGSLPAPTVAGKSFKGWYKESTYTNEVTGTSPVDLNVHTLYGKFVDSYTVTFSVPAGTVTPATTDVDTGGKVSEPTVAWTDGTVAGWYSDPTFTDTSKWNFDTNTVTAPITLYAKFMCTVTFDSQGGDPITGTTLVYGNTIPIPTNPTYEGFKFGGWFTDPECSPYNMWNFFTSKVTGNITLYAKWGTEYTITNPVKPDNGEIVILANMALNGSMVLFRVIPDEHYEIDGLPIVQTTSENTDISVTILSNNRYAFIMPSSNVTISASFKKIHYTVTLDKQNGSNPDTQSIAYGETINKPQNPEKDGYTFVNWYMNPKGTGNAYDFNTPVTSNITLYAKWDINPPEPEPVVQDGWVISNEGWQYVLNGQFLNDGFHYIIDQYGEHWYYFDPDTYMATSRWIWDDNWEGWYWVCSTGPMIENLWQWIDNAWYGFWWGGKMCQGWVWDTYYNAWFFCNAYNGRVACNEWAWDGAWYYFDQNCHMLKNTWVDGCWLNASGMWV